MDQAGNCLVFFVLKIAQHHLCDARELV